MNESIYIGSKLTPIEAIYIGTNLTPIKPADFPNHIMCEHGKLYVGDVLIFASNEYEYFTFGLRIKAIK